jgi:uncharacterized protein YhfF
MTTEEPRALHRDDALVMWREYTAARRQPGPPEDEPPVERFGDSAGLADELLGLVLAGTKRATAALLEDFTAAGDPLPRIGGHWIACDGAGRPRCVLRTVELRLGRLASVDDAFAWDEGEGDRTRADWLAAHTDFFSRYLPTIGAEFSPDLPTVFERFEVLFADADDFPAAPPS